MTLPAAVSLWDTTDANTDVPDASQISDGYALTAYPTAGVLNHLFKGYSEHCAYIHTIASEAITWTNVQAITITSSSTCLTATNNGAGNGVEGYSNLTTAPGTTGIGVYGAGSLRGVQGQSTSGLGGYFAGTTGVEGAGTSNYGVLGRYGTLVSGTTVATGVVGSSTTANGVEGISSAATGKGVKGTASAATGPGFGGHFTATASPAGIGVYGEGASAGISGYSSTAGAPGGTFDSASGPSIVLTPKSSAPTGANGGMYVTTSPSPRIYVYLSGAWHYVNLT